MTDYEEWEAAASTAVKWLASADRAADAYGLDRNRFWDALTSMEQDGWIMLNLRDLQKKSAP